MAQTRWARYAARLGAVLLVAAGAAWLWAAVQRWWPECGGQSLGSPGFNERQDHLYDYLTPTEPWVPIGSAASSAGAGCLLMAGGLLLVLPALATEWSRTVAVLALATQALVVVPVGLSTLIAGLAETVHVPLLLPAAVAWAFLLPMVFLGLGLVLVYQGAGWRDWRGPALLMGSLWLASPLVEYVLLMFVHDSHDTPPWSGALAGVALVVAGVAAWWVPEAPDSDRERDAERRVAGVAV
jgi:hypothetical protein